MRAKGRTISGVTDCSSRKGTRIPSSFHQPTDSADFSGEEGGHGGYLFHLLGDEGMRLRPGALSTAPDPIPSPGQFHVWAHLRRGHSYTQPTWTKLDFRVFHHLAHVILGFPYSAGRRWKKRSNPMGEEGSAP